MSHYYLPRGALQNLLNVLLARGYRVVGPQLRDGTVVYDELADVGQMPKGMRNVQQAGRYRLEQGDDARLFAWNHGAQGLKPYLFAPREDLWRATRTADGFRVEGVPPETRPLAFIGARACDLAALAVQDKVFLDGPYVDPYYLARREGLFVVAVDCGFSADTCFCVATGDGPKATRGFDLALTELDDGFVLEVGSPTGQTVADAMALMPATLAQAQAAQREVANATASQHRSLPANVRTALFDNLHHPRWDTVAQRCLSCGNCTQVCPTCFCHAEAEVAALDGSHSVHERRWDSCFSEGHGYIHGMQLRPERKHRYRQWLTHKLSSWHEQFGGSGCIGCGRCIVWCPAGIDLTEEAAVVCGGDHA